MNILKIIFIVFYLSLITNADENIAPIKDIDLKIAHEIIDEKNITIFYSYYLKAGKRVLHGAKYTLDKSYQKEGVVNYQMENYEHGKLIEVISSSEKSLYTPVKKSHSKKSGKPLRRSDKSHGSVRPLERK